VTFVSDYAAMTFQPLPEVDDDNRDFWTGGAHGELRIHRCAPCRTWFHPPTPVCPQCLSTEVGAEVASGRAHVRGFSINVQPWAPDMVVPYVVAVVALDDAPGVQLTTRLIDVQPQDVTTDLAVEVSFLEVDDIYLPLFRPLPVSGAEPLVETAR
jgi:uncharacterized OB-fold protein